MTTMPTVEDSAHCPYLTPVIVDSLWLRPLGAYCSRPGRPVRVAAESTLARLCSTPAFERCDGYRESTGSLGAHVTESP
jgi:hypothetical protein